MCKEIQETLFKLFEECYPPSKYEKIFDPKIKEDEMPKRAETISVELRVPTWEAKVEDIWPDRDWPENPTVDDAIERISDDIQELGFHDFVDQYCLLDGGASLWVNGEEIYNDKTARKTNEPDPPPTWHV